MKNRPSSQEWSALNAWDPDCRSSSGLAAERSRRTNDDLWRPGCRLMPDRWLARISHRLSSPALSVVEGRSGREGWGCKACDPSTPFILSEVEGLRTSRGPLRRFILSAQRKGPTERNAADTVLSDDAVPRHAGSVRDTG
jgi:hypothetical protein